MDVTQIYSLSLGGALVFLLTYRACHTLITRLSPLAEFFVTVISLPRPLGRLGSISPKTWSRLGLFIAYIGGTLTCNILHISSLSQASSRAAKLCLANILPLMVCSPDLAAHLLGTSLDFLGSVHRVLGTMSFLQVIAHSIIHFSTSATNIYDMPTKYGIAALVLFACLALSFLFKSEWYDFFVPLHHVCALGLVITILWHVPSGSKHSRWLVLSCILVYVTTLTIRLIHFLFRNVSFVRRGQCLISRQGNYLEILVFPARPWTIRAGERVNLMIPRTGLFSLLQTHPFVVVWWDKDELGTLDSITLLVRPRSGFTRKLLQLSDTRHTAWIDGPYGPDPLPVVGRNQLPDYGHLFMIATGIGVAAQIPYMKQIMEGYQQGTVRTQRMTLIWQLDETGDYEGAVSWLQQLIVQDGGYNLRILIFDPTQPTSTIPMKIGRHKLIELQGGDVDWQDEFRQELEKRVGKMLITISAQLAVRNVFRRLARKHHGTKVELLELEFQPWQQRRSIWSYF